MENSYIKVYDFIVKEKELDLYESYLLCMYLNKYFLYGKVIASDTKDAECLKISDKYVRARRKHLESLGIITCKGGRGKPKEIIINNGLIKKVNEINETYKKQQ